MPLSGVVKGGGLQCGALLCVELGMRLCAQVASVSPLPGGGSNVTMKQPCFYNVSQAHTRRHTNTAGATHAPPSPPHTHTPFEYPAGTEQVVRPRLESACAHGKRAGAHRHGRCWRPGIGVHQLRHAHRVLCRPSDRQHDRAWRRHRTRAGGVGQRHGRPQRAAQHPPGAAPVV